MTGAAGPAEQADAVVIGGGIAGLVAARALTATALRPVLLEASGAVGGLISGGVVGGYEIDLGAEGFAVRRPEVRELAESLGLQVELPAAGSWVWAGGRTYPVPAESVLGIPADPLDHQLRAVLGADGAARAARDADLDVGVGADAEDLASLVRARMGEAVLDRLVRPVAGGIHAADPADLAVDAVAPGLRIALSVQGSLAGAVRAMRALAPPGPAVASIAGGLLRLPRALAAADEAAGAEIRTNRTVTALRRLADGWEVEVDGTTSVRAARLVLATPARTALDLLAPVLPGTDLDLPAGTTITHVTLVVRAPALDGAPRGAGLLVSPDPRVRAKALTHSSAKWPWLAAATAPGVHVLRLSYGRPGEPVGDVGADEALADARLLLGADVEELLDVRVVRREGALAPATPAHRAAVADLVGRTAALPGLTVTGAWVAGTGLAAVVPHAHAVASRLTR